MWRTVELCGIVWHGVELCGTVWSGVELCGKVWCRGEGPSLCSNPCAGHISGSVRGVVHPEMRGVKGEKGRRRHPTKEKGVLRERIYTEPC